MPAPPLKRHCSGGMVPELVSLVQHVFAVHRARVLAWHSYNSTRSDPRQSKVCFSFEPASFMWKGFWSKFSAVGA